MKTSPKKAPLFLILGLLVAFVCFTENKTNSRNQISTCSAGSAKVNITPGTPIPMQGYGDRTEPFKGVRDSLYATATVFNDGSNTSVIVTADLIGFSHEFCEETTDIMAARLGIEKDFILLIANHNHGGPVNKTYVEKASNEVEAYVSSVQQKIIDAATEAKNRMRPAMVGFGIGTCAMNINRRARFADGHVGLGRNLDGPCDHDVAVVRVDDMDRNPIAILVNWPCHATTSGWENYQITGDWPGAAARFIEKSIGDDVIVPVTAGASADINPIYGPNNNFRDIDAIGMLLAEEVLRITETIQTIPNASIDAKKMSVKANGKKRLESTAPNQKLESSDPVQVNLSVLKIGNIIFTGVSGELMTEIGMRIKKESPFKNTIIVTHCDGASGYLCTNQTYPEGGYEAMVSVTMPGTEYLISDNLNKMIREFN